MMGAPEYWTVAVTFGLFALEYLRSRRAMQREREAQAATMQSLLGRLGALEVRAANHSTAIDRLASELTKQAITEAELRTKIDAQGAALTGGMEALNRRLDRLENLLTDVHKHMRG